MAALVEGSLTHSRLVEMSNDHPHDLSKTLHELVEQRFLDADGTGRGKYYFLPGCHPVPDEALSSAAVDNKLSDNAGELSDKLSDKDSELSDKEDELSDKLSDKEVLQAIAEPVSSTQRSSREYVKTAIVELCSVMELSALEISGLLNRKEQTVRQYIEELCKEEMLMAKYPLKTHPRQKYRASSG